MIWALAQGGAMAGGAVMNWLNARKQRTPEFHRTRTGQYLGKMSREGAYGNTSRRRILDATSKAASNQAQMGKASMLGYLEARGQRDSISGAKSLNEQDMNVQRTVADQANRIEVENERTKTDAMMSYVQGADAHSEARRRETQAANAGLIGGVAGATGQVIQGFEQRRQEGYLNELPDAQYGNLKNAVKAGIKISPSAMRYFMNSADSPFTTEEMDFIRENPDLFR